MHILEHSCMTNHLSCFFFHLALAFSLLILIISPDITLCG